MHRECARGHPPDLGSVGFALFGEWDVVQGQHEDAVGDLVAARVVDGGPAGGGVDPATGPGDGRDDASSRIRVGHDDCIADLGDAAEGFL
jgi:hypothetical protein